MIVKSVPISHINLQTTKAMKGTLLMPPSGQFTLASEKSVANPDAWLLRGFVGRWETALGPSSR